MPEEKELINGIIEEIGTKTVLINSNRI